jgi:hypothetical protein
LYYKKSGIVDTPQLQAGNYDMFTLPDLYDLLAEETVKFNKQLLQKISRDDFGEVKATIKHLQEEIKKRKAATKMD